jgi:hypothetical protein
MFPYCGTALYYATFLYTMERLIQKDRPGLLTIPSIMNMVMKSLNLDIMRLDDEQVEIEARNIWQ